GLDEMDPVFQLDGVRNDSRCQLNDLNDRENFLLDSRRRDDRRDRCSVPLCLVDPLEGGQFSRCRRSPEKLKPDRSNVESHLAFSEYLRGSCAPWCSYDASESTGATALPLAVRGSIQ